MKYLSVILIGIICTLIGAAPFIFLIENQTEQTWECPKIEEKECEQEIITKEVPLYITKEIVKEIPVEKICPKDDRNIVYVESPDCRGQLVKCNEIRADAFNLYYAGERIIQSYRATTTDFIASYETLLNNFKQAILSGQTQKLNEGQVDDFMRVWETSRLFLERHK